ncbi:hypothetical protein [Psychroserpens sp. MEBiC05023]
MKTFTSTQCFASILILLISVFGYAQHNKSIISSFEKYTELPRELAYVQLNKSTYIKGEMIGLSAYVLDKASKNPSRITTNLYCTISDTENNIIKNQLIKVDNGFASSTFQIDSLFTSGEYVVKAYTNWMRNFDEQNLFIEHITIIDPEVNGYIKPETIDNVVDAQFLPEGGHLLADVQNTLGVVVKNAKGFGIPFAYGEVFDSANNMITNFKTNELGLGRFLLTPSRKEAYAVKFEHLGKVFTFLITDIKSQGISITVNDLNDQVAVTLKTNINTLASIKNKPFQLSIHNGSDMKVIDFSFDNQKITKLIDYQDLYKGINVFTLFNDQNQPILERLFFKYDDINTIKTGDVAVDRIQDSLRIKVPLKQFNTNITSNISVSVLPSETKSYNRHHNFISYTYLQPYIKGHIENAGYYFKNINRKTKFELDNLLLTQGWSSYDWNSIFNHVPTNTYPFENGIGFKANVNGNQTNQYIMYGLSENNGDLFTLTDGQKAFLKSGLYPMEGEPLKIGEINSKGKLNASRLYLQFYPSKIPNYNNEFTLLSPKVETVSKTTSLETFAQSSLDKIQKLNQVVIKAKPKYTRSERLKARSYGKVDVFDDKMRLHNPKLAIYFSRRGFVANDYTGEFTISHRTLGAVTIFLDGVRLTDYGFLSLLNMNIIDYIEIKRTGLGDGLASGAAGPVIKIWTDPSILLKKKVGGEQYKAYNMPLTFTKPKSFYVPKYQSYSSDFFKEYGIIGWTPNATMEGNNILMNVFNTNTDELKLIIEGIDANGRIISEEKTVRIN